MQFYNPRPYKQYQTKEWHIHIRRGILKQQLAVTGGSFILFDRKGQHDLSFQYLFDVLLTGFDVDFFSSFVFCGVILHYPNYKVVC